MSIPQYHIGWRESRERWKRQAIANLSILHRIGKLLGIETHQRQLDHNNAQTLDRHGGIED